MADELHGPESLQLHSMCLPRHVSDGAIKSVAGHAAGTDIWGEKEMSWGSVSSGSDEAGDEAELTQQMAQYLFQEDDNPSDAVPGLAPYRQHKTWGLATSPQSTLWSPFGSTQNGSDCGWDEKHKLAHTDYQSRSIQFYKQKQEEGARKQLQSNKERGKSRPLAQLQLLQPPTCAGGSGMRAVFLGSKGGSCGTGVFLPRATSNPSESRNKLGCSSVLIPAKVAHALKLHFHHVGLVSRPNTTITNSDTGKNDKGDCECEMGLPQEWTY